MKISNQQHQVAPAYASHFLGWTSIWNTFELSTADHPLMLRRHSFSNTGFIYGPVKEYTIQCEAISMTFGLDFVKRKRFREVRFDWLQSDNNHEFPEDSRWTSISLARLIVWWEFEELYRMHWPGWMLVILNWIELHHLYLLVSTALKWPTINQGQLKTLKL